LRTALLHSIQKSERKPIMEPVFQMSDRFYSKDLWHVAWFEKWFKISNLTPRHPESFCRYWRIVAVEWILIWATMTHWLKGTIRPITFVAAIPWIGLVVLYALDDSGAHTNVPFTIIAGVFCLAGVMFGGYMLEDDDFEEFKDMNYLKNILAILGGPVMFMASLIVGIVITIAKPFERNSELKRVFAHEIKIYRWEITVLHIMTGILLLVFLVALAFFSPEIFLALVILIIVIGIAVGLFNIVKKVGRWILRTERGYSIQQKILSQTITAVEHSVERANRRKKSMRPSRWRRVLGWTSSTMGLVIDFLKVQKSGICPPVYFVETESEDQR